MDEFSAASVLGDVAYAIRQLEKFQDVRRALDALERVQEAVRAEAMRQERESV